MKKIIQWIFSSGSVDEIRTKFYVFFATLGVVTLIFYALLNLYIQNSRAFIINIVAAAIFLVLNLVTLRSKSSKYTATVAMIPLLMLTVNNFVNGGLNGFGAYWTFILPPVALFMASVRVGLSTVLIYLIFTNIYFIAGKIGISPMLYSDMGYLNYFLSFCSVSIMSFFFKTAWKLSNKVYVEQNEEVVISKQEVDKKVLELEMVKSKLEKSNAELKEVIKQAEIMNRNMVDRELTMVELKNEIKNLEEKLKK